MSFGGEKAIVLFLRNPMPEERKKAIAQTPRGKQKPIGNKAKKGEKAPVGIRRRWGGVC